MLVRTWRPGQGASRTSRSAERRPGAGRRLRGRTFRSRTSCTTVATWVPSSANTYPTLTPRELISPWHVNVWSCHRSAATGRWK